MCQRIIQFCSGSTKPLVYVGSLLSLLLAVGLGYVACSAMSLYQDIDPAQAQSRSLAYHLQLAASVYLILISLFACFATHYEQKHLIGAVATLSSVNFVLALAAIFMIPSGNPTELAGEFKIRLGEAMPKYDFKQKPEVALEALTNSSATSAGSIEPIKVRQRRLASTDGTNLAPTSFQQQPLNASVATKLWDSLQGRGCCGLTNSTDWGSKLPKSCCSKPEEDKESKEFSCKATDEQHKLPCIELIGSIGIDTKNITLLLILTLIALLNLYLANVTGISVYRTLHYDEASQNAYT